MTMTVAQLAESIGATLLGDGAGAVARGSGADDASAETVVFALTPTLFEQAVASAAGAVIAGAFAAQYAGPKPVLVAKQPKLAFARAVKLLAGAPPAAGGVHASAMVAPTAALGQSVSIGPYAVVGEGVAIGDRTQVGAGVAIGDGVRIGPDCRIHPNVVIYAGTEVGARVVLHAGVVLGSDGFGYVMDEDTGAYEAFPQIGTLRLEDDVEIGANTTIDRGALGATVIGAGTKIDNLVQVAHNVRIGRHVAISAQTGIAGSSSIADRVIVGGQAGIADHVRIEEGVILGAQAGVPTSKILRGKGVVFWGSPARPLPGVLREQATLARLARKRGRE
ncbi:MAG TPA: UDP-3-O-(3-hydroxymyristoyl)glucosamine N-acyltransferase [Vicinamibacterales bacterium]|nr:UDP-3-O-(3-hydroxymyristoyl)glucosamine N-acyltransferase [Vicinamibacterales bacterium]